MSGEPGHRVPISQTRLHMLVMANGRSGRVGCNNNNTVGKGVS